MSERTAEHDPLTLVTDKRRVFGEGIVTGPPPDGLHTASQPVAPPPGYRRWMQVGEFYEIHGICWMVRKVTKHDVLLRRFTGTLVVKKADASPLQLKGARKA